MNEFLKAWFMVTLVGGILLLAKRMLTSKHKGLREHFNHTLALMKSVQDVPTREEFRKRIYFANTVEELRKIQTDIYKELNKWSQQERI
jgi:hypothetical protein